MYSDRRCFVKVVVSWPAHLLLLLLLPPLLLLLLQPDLVERLVVVDISPAQTTTRTNFRFYINAMQAVTVSSTLPRSTARRMAEDQLRKQVKVCPSGVPPVLVGSLLS